MECVIGHPERPFRLYVTHLNWISPRVRLQQAEAILQILASALIEGPLINGPGAPDSDFGADWMMVPRAEVPPMPAPAILTGDFNMTPASPEYTALCGPVTPWAGRLIEQGLFGTGHQNGAATVGHLLVPEKAGLLDMPVLESPAGIVETRRQAGRDAGVNHHAFGDHVMEAQAPESAQIGRPAQMLGEHRRIETDFAGAIRQRVHAAAERNHLSLRRPAGKLEENGWAPIRKCLHQERKVETDQAASEIGQIFIFHKR
jgi:hypothetical protein